MEIPAANPRREARVFALKRKYPPTISSLKSLLENYLENESLWDLIQELYKN